MLVNVIQPGVGAAPVGPSSEASDTGGGTEGSEVPEPSSALENVGVLDTLLGVLLKVCSNPWNPRRFDPPSFL